jgi:hypothetical protein
MITQRKTIIPIFDYRLDIIIYDDWDEVKHLFDGGPEPSAITKSNYGNALVAINSKRHSSIVHECEHIKNLIWEFIGYKTILGNDEVDAYLLTYIFSKIESVYIKHIR